jgi:hypothetical protein
MPPRAQEGPGTAAEDFQDVRANINEKSRLITDAELVRRQVGTALSFSAIVAVAIIATLQTLHGVHNSPLRLAPIILGLIDLVVVLGVGVAFVMGFRSLAKKRREISRLYREIARLRAAERYSRSRIPADRVTPLLWAYHSEVLDTIEEYRKSARTYRRVHNRYQCVIIIGSLFAATISTAAVKFGYLEWAVVAASFSVSVSAGMTGYFKFRERSMNLQQAADDLEREYKSVDLGIYHYQKIEGDLGRLVEFAERAENIKSEQRKKEQQLEQPPEGGPGASAAGPEQK